MTQPQDKMRAEFEVFLQTSPAVPDWARNDVFDADGYRDMYVQMMWQAWQAACAQQYAQSQQDAGRATLSPKDALAAWRLVIPGKKYTDDFESARVGDYNKGWNDCQKSVVSAIDAAIAAQGASNV